MMERTVKRVERTKLLLSQGWTHRQIAEALGVSRQTVSDYVWRHVKGRPPRKSSSDRTTVIYERWMTLHDIRGIGERAVRETA